ncbi:hypothetical protein [Clostridium sp. FP1]|nr:hypothetical protein [Clostridium sp. FP1]
MFKHYHPLSKANTLNMVSKGYSNDIGIVIAYKISVFANILIL